MIQNFSDNEIEKVFNGTRSNRLPSDIQNVARRKLRMIAAAKSISDLRIPPANRLEPLKGNLEGFWSIQINDQWRVIFRFDNGGAKDVKITDYH